MLENPRWTRAALAVAAALACAPLDAAAQTFFRPGDERCASFGGVTTCFDDGAACGSAATCRRTPTGVTCVPADRYVCCVDDGDCYEDEDGTWTTCQRIAGINSDGGGAETGVCVRHPWCDFDMDGAISASELYANFTDPTGVARPRWEDGDADSDGLSNGEEADELGTDPCVKPAPRGFWTGSGCAAIPSCHEVDEGCLSANGAPGTCQLSEDGNGTECAPGLYEVAWCGRPPFVCTSEQIEDEDDETGVSTGYFWCVPDDCAAYAIDHADCVHDSEGNPVAWDDGNCDGDEYTNAEDESVCGTDASPDAGVPTVDAGANVIDGGGVDGGVVAIDAGDPSIDVQPTFGGGGGCRCRAAPTRDGAAPLALVALLGLVLARRRR